MGVGWWLRRLRMGRCHCRGAGLIPGLGTFACQWRCQKRGGAEIVRLRQMEITGHASCLNAHRQSHLSSRCFCPFNCVWSRRLKWKM